MKDNKVMVIVAYCVAGVLLGFYLIVLYFAAHPRVSDDYRMRYLEEGYFWEEHEEDDTD